MENIFDGIQRPLEAIAKSSGDCFIPRGVNVPALDVVKQWEFQPGKLKVQFFGLCPYTRRQGKAAPSLVGSYTGIHEQL